MVIASLFRGLFSAILLLAGFTALPALAQTRPLNDTGITWSGHATSGNATICDPAHPAGQDCHYGRDKEAGGKGFSFTALNSSGQPTTPGSGATSHPCVRDNVTGLIWEVKTDDGGLHDKDWTYTWYKTNSPDGNNGMPSGTANCKTVGRCDTEKFVQDVNAAGWCGYSDWRMPTRLELQGIVDYGRFNPSIDRTYFPNTLDSTFWSANQGSRYEMFEWIYLAWLVDFGYGIQHNDYRIYANGVRLVRGG